MVIDMKKTILVLIFVLASFPIFSQNLYFSEPTSFHVDTIFISGQGPIAYRMYVANGWVVHLWKAKLIYPDDSETNWTNGQTGGWWVNESGDYTIKGQVSATYWPTGQTFTLNKEVDFTVIDPYSPIIPLNLAVSWSGDHPLITWSANTEIDMDTYNIQKMVVG
jgi:hypothetical protein